MVNPNLKKIKYSVIILIYHRTPKLVKMAIQCAASVYHAIDVSNTEVIIVDNGSTERFHWEKYANTYIRFDENKGISAGWNAGIKASRGQYICILGDDVIVHDGYLEALEKCFEKPACGVANVHVEHLPAGMGIVEDYKWYSGACFMLKQKTIEKVGYFDEEIFFPANFEDWSFWCKVYQAGLKLYKNFTFSVQHREGQTVHSPDISVHNDENKKRFIEKWGFDPVPVFCGDVSIHDALNKVKSN